MIKIKTSHAMAVEYKDGSINWPVLRLRNPQQADYGKHIDLRIVIEKDWRKIMRVLRAVEACVDSSEDGGLVFTATSQDSIVDAFIALRGKAREGK